MAEVIVPAVVNPVAENSVNVIGRQFGYLWNYKKNMDNLEKQVTALESKMKDMDRCVDVETRNAKKISDQVEKWLSEARDFTGQARKFLEDYKEKGKMRCLVGLCPNLVSRYQFGRKACKMEKDVADVITKEVQIREVSFPLVGQDMPILSTEGFFTFDSRKSILEDIMKALQTEPKSMVGLYGFGGMGKTTLAKQVAKQAEKDKLFEEIVFASVTQKVDMKEIQGQLASMLDLKLEESTVAERASLIHQRLKGKKVLVILDDLWKELDLKEVGVPFGAEHMGCKILLTSRSRQVLTSMGTGKDFNLGALEEKEAWKLFEEKTADVLKNPDFHDIGKKVAKRCQGLPVLIVTVAASLSKRPQLPAWNDALRQLKEMDNKQMHEIVNSAIESISYNHLKKTHKQLFLLCGIIGGDASIEEVLQYSWGLDLFDEESVTIQAARDRLHNLIIDLKESCLLLDDVDERNSIKMHDVVRDVAISIGGKDSNMLSIREYGAELNIWRKVDDLKRCTAMVLRGCPNLPDLPSHLECPSLELFVMSGLSEDSSPSIPATFFEKTSKLKVLGLSQLSFTVLPSSISFLENLQTLRVNHCGSLKDNYEIQYVVNVEDKQRKAVFPYLESLHLEDLVKLQKVCNGPLIKGSFQNLTSVKVKGCNELKSLFSVSMATGLPRLQEIQVSNCHALEAIVAEKNIKDDINDGVCEEIEFAQLRKLTLEHLPKLKNFFSNGEIQNKSQKSLQESEIYTGEEDELKSSLPFFTKVSFPKLEELVLIEVSSFKYLLSPSVATGFVGLKSLEVKDCAGIKHLVVAEEEGESNKETLSFPQLSSLCFKILPNLTTFYSVLGSNDTATQPLINEKVSFPKLEKLELSEIPNLTEIWSHRFQETSCSNLTNLSIIDCKSLKHVFPAHVAQSLNKLQDLSIVDCEEVETIIGDENYEESPHAAATFMFFKLNQLILHTLPKLKCFYPRKHTIDCPVLESLVMADCGNISIFDILTFPSKQGDNQFEKAMSKLESLSIRSTDLEKIRDLYYHFPPHLFSSLEGLCIVRSDVFPSEFLGIIHKQLKLFGVVNCSFQEIFSYEGEFTNHVNDHTLFLPQVTELILIKLPELKYICKHDQKKSFILDILGRFKTVFIAECPLLTNIVQPSIARSLKNLRELTIIACEIMEKIIGDDDDEESSPDVNEIIFPNLEELELSKLPRLTNFCSSPNYNFSFPQLRHVTVRECPNMKIFCGGTTTTPKLKEVQYEGKECWEGDLNTTVQKIFSEMEAKRLTTSLPSTSSSNHVESNANVHENSSEELTEPIPMVVQNATNPEKEYEVYENSNESRKGTETREKGKEGSICVKATSYEKGKGKEVEVSEITRHSDPSTNNYTNREQTVAGSVASSSKSSSSEEFQRLTTTLPSASSNTQFGPEAEIHEKAAESTKEHQNYTDKEQTIAGSMASQHVVASSEETNPPAETSSTQLEVWRSTSTVESEATDPKKGSKIDEEVLQGVKLVHIYDRAQEQLLPPISNTDLQVTCQQKDPIHAKSAEKVNDEPIREAETGVENFVNKAEICDQEVVEEGQVSDAHDKSKGKEYDVSEETVEPRNETSHCLKTEPETGCIAASSSYQESFRGLRETFQVLEAQPMSGVSAEQVRFMEEASEWFSGYVKQAREYLEQKELISELDSKIDDMEAQLQVLKEKKRVAEEKKKVASRVAKFG